MRALRAPDGCPWDREQTHASLRPFLLEETYEALEAIDSGSPMQLCEELGDVLFEVVFMSRLSEEAGDFTIADTIAGHSPKVKTTLSGVPKTLPSLLRAYEISARAAAVGFDWARADDVLDKIQEEVDEVRREVESGATGDLSRAEEEMGDLLFAIANLSRTLGLEPEGALRRANAKFTRRFEAVEQAFKSRGSALHDATLEEMEAEWQRVKTATEGREI